MFIVNGVPFTGFIENQGDTWYYKDGVLHRDGDEPAVTHSNGAMEWFKNGIRFKWKQGVNECYYNENGDLHREDGPAKIEEHCQTWYFNGVIHRDGDGPSVLREYDEGYWSQCWFKNGLPHRDGDLPAVISSEGLTRYYKDGVLHRDGDEPAVIEPNGEKKWYKNGVLHRENGPAYITQDGDHYYYKNGLFHREDGPAIVKKHDFKEWWVNGKKIKTRPGLRDLYG